jgi:predicted Zn-dependent protease
MITATQPNNAAALREFLRIGVDPSQENLAQQLYKKAYLEPVGSQDRTDRANEALNKNQPLIDADPGKQDVVPWTRHARLLLILDEANKALGILNDLLTKYPQDPYVWFHLGEAHYRQGLDDERNGSNTHTEESYAHATTAFKKAWEITPRVHTADRLAACWVRRKKSRRRSVY